MANRVEIVFDDEDVFSFDALEDTPSEGFVNASIFGDPPVAGRPKVWNGSAWVRKPLKIWNGSAWVEKPVKRWNGSAWVAIVGG